MPNAKQSTTSSEHFAQCWELHRDNSLRHIVFIARHIEAEVMNELTKLGYPRLSMHYAQPMSILAVSPLRPGQLAAQMGISKQHCVQTLKPLYRDGFISEHADPADRRAKLVALTEMGRGMVEEALRQLGEIHRSYGSIADELGQHMATLLGFSEHQAPQNHWLTTLAGLYSRRLQERLLQLCAQRGHGDIQLSYLPVLINTDLDGSTVGELAKLMDVTGQAVSRIARELQQLGYNELRSDRSDQRARRLFHSPKGLNFVRDFVAAQDNLMLEEQQQLGKTELKRFHQRCQSFAQSLGYKNSAYRPRLRAFQPASYRRLAGDSALLAEPLSAEEELLAALWRWQQAHPEQLAPLAALDSQGQQWRLSNEVLSRLQGCVLDLRRLPDVA